MSSTSAAIAFAAILVVSGVFSMFGKGGGSDHAKAELSRIEHLKPVV